MNEDFVPYELAVKLDEKGFNKETSHHYNDKGKICVSLVDEKYPYPCPTIPEVLKWLRDTHKLFVSPCIITDYEDDFTIPHIVYWSYIVVNIESGDSIYREYERVIEKRYETYEQAALAGIEYVLDNLI